MVQLFDKMLQPRVERLKFSNLRCERCGVFRQIDMLCREVVLLFRTGLRLS